jgi:maleylpyruvate isomerase
MRCRCTCCNGGEQLGDAYRAVNPAALLPALEDDGNVIGQSLAIIEYWKRRTRNAAAAARRRRPRPRARAGAEHRAGAHPLGNLRVLKYLTGQIGVAEEVKLGWQQHWLRRACKRWKPCWPMMRAPAVSATAIRHAGRLLPGAAGVQRAALQCRHLAYPTVMRIHAACSELPAFQQAHPSQQPDAE